MPIRTLLLFLSFMLRGSSVGASFLGVRSYQQRRLPSFSVVGRLLTTLSSSMAPPTLQDGDIMFGKFVIPSGSIFYRSPQNLSYAFVNLRPIVRGHVLVVPDPVIKHMKDLSEEHYIDLWKTVRKVQDILQEAYPQTSAFNVAVQDGVASGQSVPHVHVHILPRHAGDYERNDDIYDHLQSWAPREELQSKVSLEVLPDEERKDRTTAQMAEEAARYRAFAESSKL